MIGYVDSIGNLGRVVSFYPKLANVLQGIPQALFVQQMIYWTKNGHQKDGWIYKTATEWKEETSLSKDIQMRVRKKLRNLGIIEEKHDRMNHRLFFRLNKDPLDRLINEYESAHTQLREVVKPNLPGSETQLREVVKPNLPGSETQPAEVVKPNQQGSETQLRKTDSEINVKDCDSSTSESENGSVFPTQITKKDYLEKKKKGSRARAREGPPHSFDIEIPDKLRASSEFMESWKLWILHRIKKKEPLYLELAERQMKKCAKVAERYGVEGVLRMLDYSLDDGYLGLFPNRAAPPKDGYGATDKRKVYNPEFLGCGDLAYLPGQKLQP